MPDDRTRIERRSAPAAERNIRPICDELVPRIGHLSGLAVEIGSGTGQHVAALSPLLPRLDWQPTDADPDNLPSIRGWAEDAAHSQIRAPRSLDATERDWQLDRPCVLVMAFNVIHIAPWAVCEGIISGAARHLKAGGLLVFYGPFREAGRHTAPSNADFDEMLRARNPAWGVRNLEDVAERAATEGLETSEVVAMPANNRLVLFRNRG